MPRFFRILGDAVVLTGGLLMYAMLVFGAFQYFFFHPLTIGISAVILACLGFCIHRGYWKNLATTMAVVGLSSFLMLLGGLSISPPMSLMESIKTALYFFLTIYFAFFWLPFALGAVVASIVSRFARTPALADSMK
jgi:ABC-type proline/glycine betaine transport system permease subunit